jgi:hypothetical protein
LFQIVLFLKGTKSLQRSVRWRSLFTNSTIARPR